MLLNLSYLLFFVTRYYLFSKNYKYTRQEHSYNVSDPRGRTI